MIWRKMAKVAYLPTYYSTIWCYLSLHLTRYKFGILPIKKKN